jgi:hypothetical protein
MKNRSAACVRQQTTTVGDREDQISPNRRPRQTASRQWGAR